jgi:glucose/mannose-6-phosphate isomerase
VLSLNEVNGVDGAGLWRAYEDWPDVAGRALDQKLVLPRVRSPKAIVLAGMGGSGAACGVVYDWLLANSRFPVSLLKDYRLPEFVDERSLVLAISLSGNTKEMLGILDESIDRRSCVVALSSGGAMERTCLRRGIPHNRVEKVMVPRASVPSMVFVALRILNDIGLVKCEDELREAVVSMRRVAEKASPSVPFGSNAAKKLAKVLYGKRAAIYTAARHASVGHHFRASMNENAKIPVYAGCYPEIFHNEIETWSSPFERAVVLVRHRNEDEAVRKKLVRSKWLMSRAGMAVSEVFEGGGLLASLLDWCLFLDLVSLYVAVLRKTPPVSTPLLDSARLI